jgi:hypothetical protein
MEYYAKADVEGKVEYEKAIADWSQLVEINPGFIPDHEVTAKYLVAYRGNNFPAWVYLGIALYDLGKEQTGEEAMNSYRRAIACFDEALNRNLPQREVSLNGKAYCYVYLGDTKNAAKTYKELAAASRNQELIGKALAESTKMDFDRKEWEARLIAEYGGICYVSASGSDDNDGLTEATAFKTLRTAFGFTRSVLEDSKAVVVIGALNQSSESGDNNDDLFHIFPWGLNNSYLITGIPYAPEGKKAVLSAAGTDKIALGVYSSQDATLRVEHIEISGSKKRGLTISVHTEVTLGEGAVVCNNTGGGVLVFRPRDELRDSIAPGHLIIDGGIIENNRVTGRGASGGGVVVQGKLTMKWGFVRNNAASEDGSGGGIFFQENYPSVISGGEISGNTALGGGGIFIEEGTVTMTGGAVTGNTGVGSGVVIFDGVFNQNGGTVSGNKAPSGYQNIQVYRQ